MNGKTFHDCIHPLEASVEGVEFYMDILFCHCRHVRLYLEKSSKHLAVSESFETRGSKDKRGSETTLKNDVRKKNQYLVQRNTNVAT